MRNLYDERKFMDEKINKESEAAEIDLKRLVMAVIRRLWIVILASVMSASAVLVFTYYMITPQYNASAMFYVNNSTVSLGQTAVSITSGDLTAAKSLVDSYIVILKTRSSLVDVIDYAGVNYSYSEVKGMISAAAVNSTEIFEVVVTCPDPEDAEKIANAIAHILPNKISDIIEGTSAKVVEKAVKPSSPSSPSYVKNALSGFVVGLLVSVCIIVLKEIFDVTIRSDDDIAQVCSVPILASVPDMYIESRGKYYYSGYSKQQKKKKPAKSSPIKAESNFVGKNLSFAAAEANKMLRTKLLFSFADDSACHVLGVSSAIVNEGKSLSSVNLAYSLAQLNKKVLLIDCDLRRPSVHKKLKFKKGVGFTEYLTGQVELGSVIQTSVDSDSSLAFDVIPCGETPPNPMELLSSEKMKNVLTALRKSYDYIVVDLPPIGEVSDALALAKLVDGMLLVVRQNYCTRTALSQAVKQFEFVESKILGIIFNCTSEKEYRYKYGRRYGKYSKYTKYGSVYESAEK